MRARPTASVRPDGQPPGPQIALAQNQRFYSVAVMASGDAIDAVRAAPFPHHRCQRNRSSGSGSRRAAPAEIQRSGARISHEKKPSKRNKSRFRRQRLISRLLNGSTGSFFGEARSCSGAGWCIVIVYKLRHLCISSIYTAEVLNLWYWLIYYLN